MAISANHHHFSRTFFSFTYFMLDQPVSQVHVIEIDARTSWSAGKLAIHHAIAVPVLAYGAPSVRHGRNARYVSNSVQRGRSGSKEFLQSDD